MSNPTGPTLFLSVWKTYHEIMKADNASILKAGFRSRSDFAVLEVLLHKGPLPINTIGNKVLLTSGSITTAIQRLEKQGWVQRTAEPEDKRKVRIELTQKGHEHISTAFEEHAKRLEEVFSPLSSEEKSSLLHLFKKLRTQQPQESR